MAKTLVLFCIVSALFSNAAAGGGPLGIDYRLSYDNSGIWQRNNQKALAYGAITEAVAGAIWEGGETRLGRTYWQAIDSSIVAGISVQGMKHVFTRVRPAQTDNPNLWFQGGSNYSFPSGEVAAVSSIVTPFVLEYGREYPLVYALEALPLYDAIARLKVRGHWQTDVLAGLAVGTLAGYYAHSRTTPFVLSVMPNGVAVGLRARW